MKCHKQGKTHFLGMSAVVDRWITVKLVLCDDSSETKISVAKFMSQLDSSHPQGIGDVHYTFGDEL
jgi:hypothetical protein